jgi:hypothetical protein
MKQGTTDMSKFRVLLPALFAFCVISASTISGYANAAARESRPAIKLTTEFQAILLSNGQVYFGRLDSLKGDYLIMREVYYVQTAEDPKTKKAQNILVKRGKEWHAPGYMILNAHQVILIEPVAPDSTVAKLINQLNKK